MAPVFSGGHFVQVKSPRTIPWGLLLALGLMLCMAWWWPKGVAVSPRESPMPSAGAARLTADTPARQNVTPPLVSPAPGAEREPPATAFLRRLAAELEALRHDPGNRGQDESLESLAQGIAVADLPAAVEFLNRPNSPAPNRDLELRLLRRWAANDPRAAADWVSRLPPGTQRQEAIDDVAIVWAGQSITEATRWVQQLPQGPERNRGLISVAYEAARTDPLEALTLGVALPPGPARDDLLIHSASQWASRAPEAAAEWAKQITDATLRELVLAEIATAWGARDPAAAASLAVNSLPPGREQDDAVVGIVQRWVQKEPEKAAAWVVLFPDGALRAAALEELVRLWADQDSAQVAGWLNRLSPGASRDLAVEVYVTKLAPLSPASAAHWAEDIGDTPLRLRAMEAVGEGWLANDAQAARAWITKASLPDPAKARLLAHAPPQTP